ncbi:MAG: hypothetical protein JST47_04370 [Bacteroidetes bacterium]|nr:hypothetical protein [Bacteroidota bacterium]
MLHPCPVFSQQTDLQKMLQNARTVADHVKKNTPQGKQQPGLPPGYDNSWKIRIKMTRTMVGSTNLVSNNSGCKTTKKGTLNYSIQSDLSTDSAIGWQNGDDFQMETNMDENFRKYEKPFKGSFSVNCSSENTETRCDGNTNRQISGYSNVDPTNVRMSFGYNRKTKMGDFQVDLLQDPVIHASGKEVEKTKGNPTATVDLSELGKATIEEFTVLCGLFQSWNHPVAKDAKIQSAIASSPVNGGQASIAQTKFGYEVSYSESKTIDSAPVPEGWTGTDQITYITSVQILITNQEPPRLEAIIDPLDVAGYQNFIPKGPKVDGSETEGNSIAFRVRIIDKKNGGKDVTNAHPFTVTYTLDKVSNYKGICMNYPKQNADDKPDLRWSKLSLAESHLKSSTDATLTSNQREGSDLSAFVACYDYAAYGVLKAHVHLDDDDIDLDGHLKDKPDVFFATIPFDENHNKIADKWEKDMGIYGKISDPDFDEDAYPQNQRRNGDGYTLFEEYRGFKVEDNLVPQGSHESFKDGHLRMDPNYKDIFIWDEDGLFKQYYEPYNPSDLCWHYINKDEMIYTASSKDPENRWTNFNKTDHFYAKQYALIFADMKSQSASIDCTHITVGQQIDYDKVTDYETGNEINKEGEESAGGYYDQAVKHTSIIYIYSGDMNYCLAKNFKPDQAQNIYQESVLGTTIHEIGHALGITHHHPKADIGFLGCSMRYDAPDETSHRGINSVRHYYCHKGDTWTEVVNTPTDPDNPGKAVPLKTITHPSDDCYGKIDVKSDP